MRQNLREIFTELIASNQEQELRGGSKRDLELTALADKVTVCVGVRRCGKSTLVQQQFQKLAAQGIPRENILMINFADERLAGGCLFPVLHPSLFSLCQRAFPAHA